MYGLALEGGGSKGAFHMGAVKALLEAGYDFDCIAGTSIGALNGAIIAQGDFEAGYNLWKNIDNSLLFDLDQVLSKNLFGMASRLRTIINNKGIDTTKIRTLIDNIVNEEKLRNSNTGFGLVTVALNGFKPVELYKEDIPYGNLVDYIMASANLPLFKLEPIEGSFYIDGGFYNNCPINLLVKKGYKDIIVVRTFAVGIVQKINYDDVNVLSIEPSEKLGSLLNFDNSLIQKNLNMGYYDSIRKIKGLKGRKFCIKPSDENAFFQIISSISEESILRISRLLGIEQGEPKHLLFEKIVPEIANILKLPTSSSFQDIVIAALESIAEENDVERYIVYTFNDFLEVIKKNNKNIINSRFLEKTKSQNSILKRLSLRMFVQEIIG